MATTSTISNDDDDNVPSEPQPKVVFSLGYSSKRKKTKRAVVASEFGEQATGNDTPRSSRPSSEPLVIPLPDESSQQRGGGGFLLGSMAAASDTNFTEAAQSYPDTKETPKPSKHYDDDADPDAAAAAEALMQSATDHFSHKRQQDASTNFSADGSLVIQHQSGENSAHVDTDAQQLRRDLDSRPDDVPVDSNVYAQTPISEFGAAMLRGMGWTGDNNNEKTNNDSAKSMPRPHRLGLGATPKLPAPTSVTGKMRRPDQVEREERMMKQHQGYETERQKRLQQDKQRTLQDGSIVGTASGKRARAVKLMGVPGLNRVLVQYEGEAEPTSMKRGDIMGLVDRSELEERPFREPPRPRSNGANDVNRRESEGRGVASDSRRGDDGNRNGRKEDRRKSNLEDESERDRSRDRDRRRHEEGERRKKRRSDDGPRDRKKRRREEEPKHWLLTNIRVRLVTEKLGRRQYKQKGLVLDVTHGGANATLQMSDGQVLDRVPERYLETALPKVGGNTIVLTGKHQFSKGKLLERDSKAGKGVVQVFEDMSLLTLSLDDIAELCGPLDDTIS